MVNRFHRRPAGASHPRHPHHPVTTPHLPPRGRRHTRQPETRPLPIHQISHGHITCGPRDCTTSTTIATIGEAPWLHARHPAHKHGRACTRPAHHCPQHTHQNPIHTDH